MAAVWQSLRSSGAFKDVRMYRLDGVRTSTGTLFILSPVIGWLNGSLLSGDGWST